MAHSSALCPVVTTLVPLANANRGAETALREAMAACVEFGRTLETFCVTLETGNCSVGEPTEEQALRTQVHRAITEASVLQARLFEAESRMQSGEPLRHPVAHEPMPPLPPIEPIPLPPPQGVQSLGLMGAAPQSCGSLQYAVDSCLMGMLPDTSEVGQLLAQLDNVNGTIRALDEMLAAASPSPDSITLEGETFLAAINGPQAINTTTLATEPGHVAPTPATVPAQPDMVANDSPNSLRHFKEDAMTFDGFQNVGTHAPVLNRHQQECTTAGRADSPCQNITNGIALMQPDQIDLRAPVEPCEPVAYLSTMAGELGQKVASLALAQVSCAGSADEEACKGDAGRLGNAEDTACIASLLCSPATFVGENSPPRQEKSNSKAIVPNVRACEVSRALTINNASLHEGLITSKNDSASASTSLKKCGLPAVTSPAEMQASDGSPSVLGIEASSIAACKSGRVRPRSRNVELHKGPPIEIPASAIEAIILSTPVVEAQDNHLAMCPDHQVTAPRIANAARETKDVDQEVRMQRTAVAAIVPSMQCGGNPAPKRSASALDIDTGKRPRTMNWKHVPVRKLQPPESDAIETFTEEAAMAVCVAEGGASTTKEAVQQNRMATHSSVVACSSTSEKTRNEKENLAITANDRTRELTKQISEAPRDPESPPSAAKAVAKVAGEQLTEKPSKVVARRRSIDGMMARHQKAQKQKAAVQRPSSQTTVSLQQRSVKGSARHKNVAMAMDLQIVPVSMPPPERKALKVLFTGFAKTDLHRLRRNVVRLGGSVLQELPPVCDTAMCEDQVNSAELAASVRVVMPSKCSKTNGVQQHIAQTRTFKYFDAILAGAWIVSAEWIHSSYAKSCWLAECEFELSGDPAGTGGPARGRAYGSKLFSGLRMCFQENGCEAAGFSHSRTTSCLALDDVSGPRPQELERLARRGGAEIVSKMCDLAPTTITPTYLSTGGSRTVSSNERQSSALQWWQRPIVVFPGQGTRATLIRGKGSNAGWLRCPSSWMLDCISCGEIFEPSLSTAAEDCKKGGDVQKILHMYAGKIPIEVT